MRIVEDIKQIWRVAGRDGTEGLQTDRIPVESEGNCATSHLAGLLALFLLTGQPAAAPPTVLLEVWNRPIYTVGGRHLMSDALTLSIVAGRPVAIQSPARNRLFTPVRVAGRDG